MDNRTLPRLVLCLLPLLLQNAYWAAAEEPASPEELTELSIEELLNLKISGASKVSEAIKDAPASVTIISADQIRTFGYRTLADIVRSVMGLYISYDRNYDYLGIRGFGRPGDYNSRVQLLIDGYRVNDAIFDTAAIGTESLIDVDLIDHLEVIRGPASALYGANAFFGVLNIVTKSGREFSNAQVSGEYASYATGKGRLTYGRHFEGGSDLLLSVSHYYSNGQDLFFPEFNTPATNNGIATHVDYDEYTSALAKFTSKGWKAESGFVWRDKGLPTGSFGTTFNDPRARTADEQFYGQLEADQSVSEVLTVSERGYYGLYFYDAIYPYSPILNDDLARGEWWGGELKAVAKWNRHRLVAGFEFEDDFRQEQQNFDIQPFVQYLDSKPSRTRLGLYAQDEMRLIQDVIFNVGARYDHYSNSGDFLNPRLAVIGNLSESTTLKLLFGTAFRAPNAFELYYKASTELPNPELASEKIWTYEINLEQKIQDFLRIAASGYFYTIHDFINLTTDPATGFLIYRNLSPVDALGVELGPEYYWGKGYSLRTGYSWQYAREADTHDVLTNSPRNLLKLNLTAPLFEDRLRAGIEYQFEGSRKTIDGGESGAFSIVNLTLSSARLAKNLVASASLYNLLDRSYAFPGAEELPERTITQDGRNFRLKLMYQF